MPELPDVEGYRIALTEQLPGSLVREVQVLDPGVLRNATAEAFHDRLIGCRKRRLEKTHQPAGLRWLRSETPLPLNPTATTGW